MTFVLIRLINIAGEEHHPTNIFGVWDSFQNGLKRLLVSDIFIRTCEGMTDVLVILYVTNVLHISVARFGILLAILFTTTLDRKSTRLNSSHTVISYAVFCLKKKKKKKN